MDFFTTIVSGVMIYIIGQIISKFYIDPIQDLLKCIGDIEEGLIFYANVYSNPGTLSKDRINEASKEIRNLSSKLVSRANVIRGYVFFEFIGYIPSKENIIEASKNLIGLSNSLDDEKHLYYNETRVESIKKNLNIAEEGEITKKPIDKLLILVLLVIGILIIDIA